MVQIIVINSINSGSGKSLIAAHLAVMLAKEYQVMVADEQPKSKISDFLALRHMYNLQKNYDLPIFSYQNLNKQTFNQIQDFDVVILDSPDSKYFQYADIFITPLFGQEGLNNLKEKNSLYASLIWEAKKQRAAIGKNTFKWIVIPNDKYSEDDYTVLNESGKFLGFSLAPYLTYRKEFDIGLTSGITVVDKDVPKLKTLFDFPDLYARRDLKRLTDFIWQNK